RRQELRDIGLRLWLASRTAGAGPPRAHHHSQRRGDRMTETASQYRLVLETPANGQPGKTTVNALDAEDTIVASDQASLSSAAARRKVAKGLAEKLECDAEEFEKELERLWNDTLNKHRRQKQQAEAGSPEACPQITVELLQSTAATIRRPLCLIGGHAYAAAWCQVQETITRLIDEDGAETNYDPPLIRVRDHLLIVRDDGQAFGNVPGLSQVRPLAELGLPVSLPHSVPPGSGWSGAGVQRYLDGHRPAALDVFGRLVEALDQFIDFARSLASQKEMCELVACYILSTYFLDAFNVVGYLWPNGEPGSGKTTLLQTVTKIGYLGQLILAGSSYPTLRDLADYGATLAFDDAEAVMDIRRTDPDKRPLLLAGTRRGATVTVKEPAGDGWVMRHIDTFCPRLFSAIRLPDQVLGSRSIIIPLIRSGDP